MIDLDALEAKARAILPKPRFPRDPHGPALQCPKCGGHHYICSSSDERQAVRDYRDATSPEDTLALIARIRDLEAALAPFAEIYGEDDDDFPDSEPVTVKFGRSTHYALRLNHLREAARVSKEAADGTPAQHVRARP